MKNVIIISLAMFSISSLSANLWKPMGLMNNEERRQRLGDEFLKNYNIIENSAHIVDLFSNRLISEDNMNRDLLTPGIHTTLLPDFGRSFSFDGTIDVDFCNYLSNIKNENITILMPAFGVGRSIMDIISINPNAKIIANDLQDTRKFLNKLLSDYEYSGEQINYLLGDIVSKIQELKDDSIDIIYTPNLIHFLSPFEVRNLLCEFNRVLKLQGKIYISWRNSSYEFEKTSEMLHKWEIPYPRYIDENYFSWIDATIILPYNNLSINDMEKHTEKSQLLILKSGIEYPVSTGTNSGVKFGEYKFEKQNIYNANENKFMILEKPLNNFSTTQKITVDEQEYFEKRKATIGNKIKTNKRK